jgi:hypothetical protein
MIKEGKEEYEIELIIRTRRWGQGKKLQYLVHWKGYPNSDNLWVDHENLHAPKLLKEFHSQSAMAGWPNA